MSSADVCEAAVSNENRYPSNLLQRFARNHAQKQRFRHGRSQMDTKNCARGVGRALEKDCILYEPYWLEIPCWDSTLSKQVIRRLPTLPPHETLDALITPGEEASWCEFGPGQEAFRADLAELQQRLGTDAEGHWLCLALWGDAAPYSKRDSMYLQTCCVLNGHRRDRLWISVLSKRDICQCGCHGRHSFDPIFSSPHGP